MNRCTPESSRRGRWRRSRHRPQQPFCPVDLDGFYRYRNSPGVGISRGNHVNILARSKKSHHVVDDRQLSQGSKQAIEKIGPIPSDYQINGTIVDNLVSDRQRDGDSRPQRCYAELTEVSIQPKWTQTSRFCAVGHGQHRCRRRPDLAHAVILVRSDDRNHP